MTPLSFSCLGQKPCIIQDSPFVSHATVIHQQVLLALSSRCSGPPLALPLLPGGSGPPSSLTWTPAGAPNRFLHAGHRQSQHRSQSDPIKACMRCHCCSSQSSPATIHPFQVLVPAPHPPHHLCLFAPCSPFTLLPAVQTAVPSCLGPLCLCLTFISVRSCSDVTF